MLTNNEKLNYQVLGQDIESDVAPSSQENSTSSLPANSECDSAAPKLLAESEKYKSFVLPDSTTPILSWQDLSVVMFNRVGSYLDLVKNYIFEDQTPTEGKVILRNISGQINGGMHGILGASGSGKTTLMNALSYRLDPIRMGLRGHLMINGKPYNEKKLKNFAAYVMQDDVVHAEFTVYETLWYHANLRLGGSLSYEKRLERIEELLKELSIEHRRDVIVGDTRNKGISGGERKRLCIAMELLSRPKLLFLDEPTSGLDSHTALSLMILLRKMVERNELTLVTTIHQPQYKIYELFHNITLMRNGQIAYQGNTQGAELYFASIGFPNPLHSNPADHILDILAYNLDSLAPETKHFQYHTENFDITLGIERIDNIDARQKTSWHLQFGILLLRSFQQHWRRKFVIWTNLISMILITFFIGWGVWAHLGTAPSSMSKRPAVLFFCAIHQGLVFSYQSSHIFPLERSIMIRERHAGSYRISAYFLGKVLSDMFIQIPIPIIFTALVYHQVGFQNTSQKFRTFMLLMILLSQAATAMAAMISCIFVNLQITVVVLAVSFEITRLFGGWFVAPILLTKLYQWKFADALSYLKYGFVAVSLNEYEGLVLDCTQAQIDKGVICTGEQQIHKYGYQQYTINDCIAYMFVLIIGFRVLSYLALRYIKI